MKWYYYLHTNGDLIGKNPIVVDSDSQYFESDFVKRVWTIDTEDRETLWVMMLEALSYGARVDRIRELATKSKCDKVDVIELVKRVKPNKEMIKGMPIFIKEILNLDVDDFWKEVGTLPSFGGKEK